MIAFYGMSTMNIVNIVSVKIQYFPNEAADLFLRDNTAVSKEVVSVVRNLGIFAHVYSIDTPSFGKTAGPYGKIPKARALFFGKTLYQYFDFNLRMCIKENKYDHFLTFYLGGMVAYPAYYFLKCNPSMKISFIEEGTLNYCKPKSSIMNTVFVGLDIPNWKERLSVWINERPYIKKLRPAVDNTLYYRIPALTGKEDYKDFHLFRILPFPQLQRGDDFLKACAAVLPDQLNMHYRKHDFVYIGAYNARYSTTIHYWDQKTLETLIDSVGASNTLIKAHPSSEAFLKNFAKDLEGVAYVDRDSYSFEAMLSQLEDLENKVLIAQISSALCSIKLWLDREPYVIYTYRLYPDYCFGREFYMDDIVEAIRGMYSDPSKVMTPNSLDEYVQMLLQCKSRIHADRYHLPPGAASVTPQMMRQIAQRRMKREQGGKNA